MAVWYDWTQGNSGRVHGHPKMNLPNYWLKLSETNAKIRETLLSALSSIFWGVQSHDSLVRYRVEHSKINFISPRAHVLFSNYWMRQVGYVEFCRSRRVLSAEVDNTLQDLHDDDEDNENDIKAIGWISKSTTLYVHHVFLYMSCRHCTTTTRKCLISRLEGDVTRRQRLSSSFPVIWHSPLEFKSRKSCQLLTNCGNWTRWNKRFKVWGSANSLCSDVFAAVSVVVALLPSFFAFLASFFFLLLGI